MSSLLGGAKRWSSVILLSTIPTFLVHVLEKCFGMVLASKRLLQQCRGSEVGVHKVYDLVNCGPQNRFMVGNYLAHNCQFGAGVDRVMQALEEQDIFLPFEQVERIHAAYWDAFKRLKQYSYELQRQCRRNGGWILNGLGRPMCVPENLKHDTLSRVIQSTGHDILVRYIRILTKGLLHRGIPFKPWVIDWHDATAVEVPEEYLDATIATYMDSLAELNSQIGGTIQLKGTPSYGTTMADIKEPEN